MGLRTLLESNHAVPVPVTTTKPFREPRELDNQEFYFREAEGVQYSWPSTGLLGRGVSDQRLATIR